MKVKYVVFLIALGLGFTSCSEDETVTGDPLSEEAQQGTAYLSLDFSPLAPQKTSQGDKAQESNFTFSSGNIVLDQLHFNVSNDEDTISVHVVEEMEQLISVDLVAGNTNPPLSDLAIPAGTYEQVLVELTFTDETEDTLAIEGTLVNADGEEFPVRVEVPSGETITLVQEGTFVFADSESVHADIEINPFSWAGELSYNILSSLEKNEQGVIVISETSNADFLSIVLDQLEQSSEVEVTRT